MGIGVAKRAADVERDQRQVNNRADRVDQRHAPAFGAVDAAFKPEQQIPVHRPILRTGNNGSPSARLVASGRFSVRF
jgi:hypothetical protein